ncbi:MAG: hypothetical protein AAFY53_06615 [Pseudomonadota bacterium]
MTFEALLSELITSEEAAINGGQVVQAGRGASSWYGRQIEGYLGEVDLRVDIATSAKDLLAEFRSRVMSDAKQARTLRVGDGPKLPREERPEQQSSDLDAREKTTEISEEQVFTSSPACDVCPADARTTTCSISPTVRSRTPSL